jgi:hypothetical protein
VSENYNLGSVCLVLQVVVVKHHKWPQARFSPFSSAAARTATRRACLRAETAAALLDLLLIALSDAPRRPAGSTALCVERCVCVVVFV